MRLWSLHPAYLDSRGLVALWREGLLAQKVLTGATTGYRSHPQLERFRNHEKPLKSIGAFLLQVVNEAERRGYSFDETRLLCSVDCLQPKLVVTSGQLQFEAAHLRTKLARRDPERCRQLTIAQTIRPNPVFVVVSGPVADWEKGSAGC